MELSGEEKKLKALFSELKAADEEVAPQFKRVWNRAQPASRRGFVLNPAFVAAAVLIVCAVVSLAVWSRYRQSAPPASLAHVETPAALSPRIEVAAAPADSNPAPISSAPPQTEVQRRRKPTKRTSIQLAENRKLAREAKAITDWQSPTSALLSSPSDELFSSLPQLNENASGLQSYLPNRPN